MHGGKDVPEEEDLVEVVQFGVVEVAVDLFVAVVVLVFLVVFVVAEDVQLVLLVLNDGLLNVVLLSLLGLLDLPLAHHNGALAEEHEGLHYVLLALLHGQRALAGVLLHEGCQPNDEALDLEILLNVVLRQVKDQLEEGGRAA